MSNGGSSLLSTPTTSLQQLITVEQEQESLRQQLVSKADEVHYHSGIGVGSGSDEVFLKAVKVFVPSSGQVRVSGLTGGAQNSNLALMVFAAQGENHVNKSWMYISRNRATVHGAMYLKSALASSPLLAFDYGRKELKFSGEGPPNSFAANDIYFWVDVNGDLVFESGGSYYNTYSIFVMRGV